MNKKKGGALLALISCMAVLLAGCGKAQSLKSETLDNSKEQETVTIQEASVNMLSDKEKEQIELICKKSKKWIGKDTEKEPYQYYAVTDLDQNGSLEIIASTGEIGSGAFTYTQYYQVRPDGKTLEKCNARGQDDIVSRMNKVYHDNQDDIYYYITWDNVNGGPEHGSSQTKALSLKNGKIKSDIISEIEVVRDAKKESRQYYSYYIDGKRKEISEQEYDLDKLVEKYFSGLQKKDIIIQWVQFQKKWDKLSDKEIESELLKSYQLFKESMTADTEVQNTIHNPYFPYQGDVEMQVKICLESYINAEAKMDLNFEDSSSKGKLYSLSISKVEKVEKTGETPQKIEECKNLLEWGELWVTDNQIYYLPMEMSGKQKEQLLRDGTIPDERMLICQEKEIKDKLDDDEKGVHEKIEKHDGDIRCYRSYTLKENDSVNIIQFVWKKNVGLIGCRSMGHAAGGNSVLVWQEQYLKIKDLGFDIDE